MTMTIPTQAVREMVDKLISTGLVEYRTGELSRLPAECIAMLLTLVEERDAERARAEAAEAALREWREAAAGVLKHRVGNLPRAGWLTDNEDSRGALEQLAALQGRDGDG